MARFFTHDYFCSGYGGKVKVKSQFKNKCKIHELLQTGIYLKQDLTFTIDNWPMNEYYAYLQSILSHGLQVW